MIESQPIEAASYESNGRPRSLADTFADLVLDLGVEGLKALPVARQKELHQNLQHSPRNEKEAFTNSMRKFHESQLPEVLVEEAKDMKAYCDEQHTREQIAGSVAPTAEKAKELEESTTYLTLLVAHAAERGMKYDEALLTKYAEYKDKPIRAKFQVSSRSEDGYAWTVELMPVTGGSEENKAFYKSSPGGKIVMQCARQEVALLFTVGKEFYVDFIPAVNVSAP